ncbi:hypothetical protein RBK84_30685, partial [Pseudomonas aeruginosa]|uniref:hypothetical protein n=2 Tax=Gammaproteobacteria TaxID=1236 RepID=UPI0027D3A9D2
FRQALFSKIFFSTQPLAPTFKPSSDQREAHSTAFKFAVKHLGEASFRAPFGTEPLRRTTCRSASPPLGENPQILDFQAFTLRRRREWCAL